MKKMTADLWKNAYSNRIEINCDIELEHVFYAVTFLMCT